MSDAGKFTLAWGTTIRPRDVMRGILIAAVALVAACDEREVVLPGKREDPRSVLVTESPTPEDMRNTSKPIRLPRAVANAEWTQRPGTPATRTTHPALSATPTLAWSAPIGAGDSRRHRITADPVIAKGHIYTLDAAATVTATNTGGATVWQTDLVPSRETARDATGGGLAFGGGKLFVSSGFGLLTALDAASGEIVWQQNLDAIGNGTPTYYKGVVFIVSGNASASALDADTGRVRWQVSGAAKIADVLGGAAPAVNDTYAVFPFSSGELLAVFRKGGLRRWNSFLAGRREGMARANASDITGDPVIVGETLYAGTSAGRLAAISLGNGERIWTAPEGPMSPVTVIGGSVFLVSDRNELLRLDAATGDRIWGVELPYFVGTVARRQKEVYAHYGPIMAGGQLFVGSNDGKLRVYDPASGALKRTIDAPGGVTVNPVVAGGVLYVVTSKGALLAYR